MKTKNNIEDRPVLSSMKGTPIYYDINDIEGEFYMLNHDFAGCITFTFNKLIDWKIKGKVILNGSSNLEYYHMTLPFGSMPTHVMGVRLRGKLNEYGQKARLHIEGFYDMDGNEMMPANFEVIAKEPQPPNLQYASHEKVALQAAEEGIVLLKNENELLPLDKNSTLNVFGRALYEFRTSAVGAGKINSRYIINFHDGIKDHSNFELNHEVAAYYTGGEDIIPDEDILLRAKDKSDIAIMMISRASGENMDNSTNRGEYYLTFEEELLIKKLTETFKYTIAILNVGYPVDLKWVETYGVNAVLYIGFGGMLGGKALVKILDGRVNPSGKLPNTWPIDYHDIPSSMNFYNCVNGKERLTADVDIWVDTVYEEDIYVGYRYFESFGKDVAYPFGHGLSYTKFNTEMSNLAINQDGFKLDISVINIGEMAGKEVVQVYVKKSDNELENPDKELVDFKKTKELSPKESQFITIDVPRKHMTSYSEEKSAYILEAGTYIIYLGNSVKNTVEIGRLEVPKTEIIKQVENRMKPNQKIETLSKMKPSESYPKGKYSGIKEGVFRLEPLAERMPYPVRFKNKEVSVQKKITFQELRNDPTLLRDFICQMSVEELARIVVCGATGWGMEGIGEAGRIYQLEEYEMPYFPVADGNSGVNLKTPNMGMPSGVTICASFNCDLSKAVGQVIGEEAKQLGMKLILAPGFNIQRNPLNGRHPEYFSEDPFLAGKMAGSYCEGLESMGIGGCYKHCIANNAESSRKRNQSIITERAIREVYFKAFEIAMETYMPVSIMTAYNAVNGVPTSADQDLIQGLFREECGFDGMVMTDWCSYDTVDIIDMLNAGNCWLTPGELDDTHTKLIVEAVNSGRLELNRLRENVEFVLRMMLKVLKVKKIKNV